MKHCEEMVLWKYDFFLCSNGDPDIIVSDPIHFNELQLLRFKPKVTIMHATIQIIHTHMAT